MIQYSVAAASSIFPPIRSMNGIGRTFGTCGELAQGQFASGEDFLVTLPVDMWSKVQVTVNTTSPAITGNLSGKTKTELAIRKSLDYLGFPNWGAAFHIQSGLSEGKGMASSSADIIAACHAVASALETSFSPEEISRLAIEIEPTDGIMYSDVACYNHRQGKLLEILGGMPPARILVLDTGSQIDTITFNRIAKNYTVDEIKQISRAYALVKEGLQKQELDKIGLGATLSAQVNQRILPKPHFEKIIRLAQRYGASGVCAAHSGTVLGLLFAQHEVDKITRVRQAIFNNVDDNLDMFETQTL